MFFAPIDWLEPLYPKENFILFYFILFCKVFIVNQI